jgi:hypothetical protein
MERQSQVKSIQFWIALFLALAVVILSLGTYLRWWDMVIVIGPYLLPHWLSWIGAGYIAIVTPIYSIFKRRYPQHYKTLIKIHVFGNLTAFLLIAVHFSYHLGRPPEIAPILGTGLALFIIVGIMAVTGFFQRFRLIRRFLKQWRFIHVSLSLSFYIVLLIHILRNLMII